MAALPMAQFGVKHGHAAGKARAMLANANVALAGIYEPDAAARQRAAQAPAYAGVRWYASAEAMLDDPDIVALAIEGGNDESLAMAEQGIASGKHLWYDKPAGDDWPRFQRLMGKAQDRQLLVQMGYMFRYHAAFEQIAQWVRDGTLGEVFSIRAHMSTSLSPASGEFTATGRAAIADHRGGILYDLAGHMLDQIVWLLGRPRQVASFLRNDASADLPAFCDNTVGVFSFERAVAVVDIAAMEVAPMARRFEVYGTRGTAILEPFEPAPQLRVNVPPAAGQRSSGSTAVPIPPQQRQTLYDRELAAFLETLQGRHPPDRPPGHELLVQETLLRATGAIPG
jgi:predicted dehydrogenase